MAGKAVISLTTGLEDPEKVTVAFLVAVGAAESGGRPCCSRPRRPSGSCWTAWQSVSPAVLDYLLIRRG
jgi:hypothetical protein